MEFIDGKCPKCNGELKLPSDFETILCMYCGEELTPYKLGWNKNEYNYEDKYNYVVTHIADILLKHKNLMDTFKKDLYADSVREYADITRPFLEDLDKVYHYSNGKQDEILIQCADSFLKGVKQDIEQDKSLGSKKKRKTQLEKYKIILALYTIPMLSLQQMDSSEAFIDVLMNRWKKEYPDMAFARGTFEDINSGFKKSRFCFITTAVCETLNKNDDCYELTMFRDFRDNYLLRQPDGEALIKEYYDIAPAIVSRINYRTDRDLVYKEIWKNDLSDCLKHIEMGQPDLCMEHYMKMVRRLQKDFIR